MNNWLMLVCFYLSNDIIPPPPDKQNTPGILYNMYRRCNDGSALNLDDFFYFFGECCLKKMSLFKIFLKKKQKIKINKDVQYI